MPRWISEELKSLMVFLTAKGKLIEKGKKSADPAIPGPEFSQNIAENVENLMSEEGFEAYGILSWIMGL